MKKTLKAILCIVLCSVTLFSLGSCGKIVKSDSKMKKSDIIGEWAGFVGYAEFIDNGNDSYYYEATCIIIINEDGTFEVAITGGADADYLQGETETLFGSWRIDNEIIFELETGDYADVYFKNGTLSVFFKDYSIKSAYIPSYHIHWYCMNLTKVA